MERSWAPADIDRDRLEYWLGKCGKHGFGAEAFVDRDGGQCESCVASRGNHEGISRAAGYQRGDVPSRSQSIRLPRARQDTGEGEKSAGDDLRIDGCRR